MTYKPFKANTLKQLSDYKEQVLEIQEKGTFRGKEYSHILPKDQLEANFLRQVHAPDIDLHIYAHHLNSSQVLCINFFEPLLHDDEGKELLHKILYYSLVANTLHNEDLPKDGKIIETTFEKVFDRKEGTNFDFYVKYATGEQIFFEIKYTEAEFGKTNPVKDDPDKYERKWKEVYENHLKDSYYLADCNKEQFYDNYQIHRNVSYIKSEKDFVIFLYPEESENLTKEMTCLYENYCKSHRFVCPHFWEDMLFNALLHSKDTTFYKHFLEFRAKYFPDFRLEDEDLINPKTGDSFNER